MDLMAAFAAAAWALTGARAMRGMLRPALVFLLGVLAALLTLRTAAWTGLIAEGWAILVALALPLAVLLGAEAVRGVHAPRWAKLAVTALPLAVLALRIAGGGGAPPWLTAALVVGTLVGAAWWLRPRADETPVEPARAGEARTEGARAEGARVARGRVGLLFALALALAAPLVATDFLPEGTLDPLPRLGGLAVLLGIALGARLAATGGDARGALGLLLGAAALAFAIGGVLLAVGAIAAASLPALMPVLLATVLLADVLARSFGVAARSEELAFLRALARVRGRDAGAAFASLGSIAALRGARLLGPDDLADHDRHALLRALGPDGVAREGAIDDPVAADEAAHLFALHDADHLVLVSRAPLCVAAIRLGPEDVRAGTWRLRAVARVLSLFDGRASEGGQR